MKLSDCHKVYKSWGLEIWLNNPETNLPGFAYKRIYINAGKRCSLQKHEKKSETNYIISGRALVTLENDKGELIETEMGPDEFFSVPVGKIHRVYAITDLCLQECSTPEVRDCIRIEDDYGRDSGHLEIEHMTPAVLFLAAGKGTRIESHVKNYLHKALLKIDGKALISHQIEKCPKEYDLVVVLGYNGNILRSYLEAAHPDRKFTFVTVNDYESPDSGPGRSALAAKDYLQRPFYILTVDAYFENPLPPMYENWIGVMETELPELYSTALVDDENNVTAFTNKSTSGYDKAFVGIAFIKSYEEFWNSLGDSKELVSAFEGVKFPLKAEYIDWIDCGVYDGYKTLVKDSHTLAKTTKEESYQVGERFVKVNANLEISKNRISRAKFLEAFIPKILSKQDYALSYQYEQGKTLYSYDSSQLYKEFIDFYFNKILTDETVFSYTETQIRNFGRRFYFDKTFQRLHEFLDSHEEFRAMMPFANGVEVDPLIDGKINWRSLAECDMTKRWHGDLQPDNILYTHDGRFLLLDWRADFCGQVDGDINYDLAKLYAGLSFNYAKAKDQNSFNFKQSGKDFSYQVPVTPPMLEAREYLEKEIVRNGFNLDKVRIIAALIWLNMSPLHLEPFSTILYLEGMKAIANQ